MPCDRRGGKEHLMLLGYDLSCKPNFLWCSRLKRFYTFLVFFNLSVMYVPFLQGLVGGFLGGEIGFGFGVGLLLPLYRCRNAILGDIFWTLGQEEAIQIQELLRPGYLLAICFTTISPVQQQVIYNSCFFNKWSHYWTALRASNGFHFILLSICINIQVYVYIHT